MSIKKIKSRDVRCKVITFTICHATDSSHTWAWTRDFWRLRQDQPSKAMALAQELPSPIYYLMFWLLCSLLFRSMQEPGYHILVLWVKSTFSASCTERKLGKFRGFEEVPQSALTGEVATAKGGKRKIQSILEKVRKGQPDGESRLLNAYVGPRALQRRSADRLDFLRCAF